MIFTYNIGKFIKTSFVLSGMIYMQNLAHILQQIFMDVDGEYYIQFMIIIHKSF